MELELDWKAITEALLRWGHVFAGIIWIGHLYFFNWVNGPLQGVLDKETKQKVVPELMPRALFWFRWGAAWTWILGVLLLGMVFYMSKSILFENTASGETWGPGAGVMVLLVFVAPFIYDVLANSGLGKNNTALAVVGLVLVFGLMYAYAHYANFTYRGSLIHLGSTFGTIMAFNVWFRIWPLQKKIIAAVKAGQAPDAAWPAMAGARSKHNTYLSVPLVFAMLNTHTTAFNVGYPGASTVIVVAVGWLLVMMMYKTSTGVKGF
jgi:uncharacterized membrane protein